MTFQDLLVAVVTIVGFTVFMVYKGQVVAWLSARRRATRSAEARPSTVRSFTRAEEQRLTPAPPAVHMSSHAPPLAQRTGPVPGTGTTAPVPAVPGAQDLTYDEAVRAAAAIKVGGKWWLSGKKLYSLVGGNHERFLRIVAEVRGEAAPNDIPAPPADRSPIAGRPLPAGVVFHSDSPELEFQAPD